MPTDRAQFQLEIARRWVGRGESSTDLFAKFLFFFAAFNSIYFLWSQICEVPDGQKRQIENVLGNLNPDLPEGILSATRDSVAFFSTRTITKMETGDTREGEYYRRIFADHSAGATERLKALGKIVYLVRCNLVHGRKTDSGDDKQIIRYAVPRS